MHKIWLPSRQYQLLPLVYLLSGLLMLAIFGDEPLGHLSGLLLCAAAVLVWALRAYGRSKATARKP
jgi:hypothetical protein